MCKASPKCHQAGAEVPSAHTLHRVQGNRKSGPCSKRSVRKPNSPEFSTFYSSLHSLGNLGQGNSRWKSCNPPAGGSPRGSINYLAPNREREIWVREFISARKWTRGLMGTLSSLPVPRFVGTVIPGGLRTRQMSVWKGQRCWWIYTHPVPAPTSTSPKLQGKSCGLSEAISD